VGGGTPSLDNDDGLLRESFSDRESPRPARRLTRGLQVADIGRDTDANG
jgi:hypothetical protein